MGYTEIVRGEGFNGVWNLNPFSYNEMRGFNNVSEVWYGGNNMGKECVS